MKGVERIYMEGIINLFSKVSFKPKEKVQEVVNPDRQDILSQIEELKIKIGAIRCCFEFETNFDLIDSYILELSSLESRYDFLIKEAKQKNVVAF